MAERFRSSSTTAASSALAVAAARTSIQDVHVKPLAEPLFNYLLFSHLILFRCTCWKLLRAPEDLRLFSPRFFFLFAVNNEHLSVYLLPTRTSNDPLRFISSAELWLHLKADAGTRKHQRCRILGTSGHGRVITEKPGKADVGATRVRSIRARKSVRFTFSL